LQHNHKTASAYCLKGEAVAEFAVGFKSVLLYLYSHFVLWSLPFSKKARSRQGKSEAYSATVFGPILITSMETRTVLYVIAVILLASAALPLIVINLARRRRDIVGPTETPTRTKASA